ncbi:hypothetical protein [uncultured Roseibium sp.]|uniref:hypothetical protein n=1 Tax=uncultured Roseibium sp. TaxID=1936171 RepID=UPI002598CD95|nr:hypothetical protein [uncultured Roseibium sp.]
MIKPNQRLRPNLIGRLAAVDMTLVIMSGASPVFAQTDKEAEAPAQATSAETVSNAAKDLLTGWLAELAASDAFSASYSAILPGERNRSAVIKNGVLSYELPSDGFFGAGDLKLSLRFDEISFDGLRLMDGKVHASAIEVPGSLDISIALAPERSDSAEDTAVPANTGSTIEISYEDLLMEGLSLPASLPDAQSASGPSALVLSYLTALRDVKIARAFATQATATSRFDTGEMSSALYEDIVLIALEDGRIAEQTVGKIRTIEEITPDQVQSPITNMDLTVHDFVLRGLDMVPLIALLGGPVDADRTVLLDREELSGIEFSTDDVSGTIDNVLIEDIDLLSLEPLSFFPLLDQEAAGEPVAERDLAAAAMEAIGVLSLGRFQIDELEVEAEDGKGSIRRILARELSGTGARELSVDGVDIEVVDGGSAYIAHAGLSRLAFPPFAALLALDDVAEPTPSQIREALPTVGKILLSDLDLNIGSALSDPSGSTGSTWFQLDLLELLQGGFVSNIPTRTSLIIDGIGMPTSLLDNPALETMLEKLNVSEVEINHALSFAWNPDTKDLVLRNISLQLLDSGKASLSLVLGNVPPTLFTRPELAQIALASATFKSGHLRLESADLVAAFISDEAAKNSISEEQLAEGLVETLRGELGALSDTQFGADLIAAVRNFLADPDELVIDLTPAAPVPMTELLGLAVTNPNKIPERLGARVTATQ